MWSQPANYPKDSSTREGEERARERGKKRKRDRMFPGPTLLSFLWHLASPLPPHPSVLFSFLLQLASLIYSFFAPYLDLPSVSLPQRTDPGDDGIPTQLYEKRVGWERAAEQKALNYIFNRALHLSDICRAESQTFVYRSRRATKNVVHLIPE